MDAPVQLDALRSMCPEATLWKEGGREAAYLPNFRFKVADREAVMDLLLVPFAHSGYENRLFFRHAAKEWLNWTKYNVCGQEWWAVSWRGVPSDASWPQILAGHLRAVA